MRKSVPILLSAAALALLTACAEHNGPMEKAGRAVDHAANVTVKSVGKAMDKTGQAIARGGEKIQEKVDRKASGN